MSRKYKKFLQERVVPHLGHYVRVKVQHDKMPVYGKFMRMNLRPEIPATEMWIESKPFPIVVFEDQMLGCACLDPSLKTQKEEWNWERDYH